MAVAIWAPVRDSIRAPRSSIAAAPAVARYVTVRGLYLNYAGGPGGAMDRREFLETSTRLAGAALLGPAGAGTPSRPARPNDPPALGIQVGAVSFVDEGTGRVIDSLKDMAAINTLFVASFTYG